jgi:very-short-patch-repair endonuclease
MPNIKKSNKTGKFVKHATYVKKICENCGIEFEIKQSSLKYGRGRCCSRKCVDENKKRTYAGENNPSFGRKQSEEERKKRSESIKKAYELDPTIKQRQKAGVDEYIKNTGYYPGTDPVSIQKKKDTNLRKYGVEWIGMNIPEFKDRADATCIKRYGKTSLELMQEALRNATQTTPEKAMQSFLEQLDIKFIVEYKLVVDDIYRYFDFMLVDYNILLEVDGDYWHCNPSRYDRNNLDEAQTRTLENDAIKNDMARRVGIPLVRFWASEIESEQFVHKLKEVLNEKGTVKKN